MDVYHFTSGCRPYSGDGLLLWRGNRANNELSNVILPREKPRSYTFSDTPDFLLYFFGSFFLGVTFYFFGGGCGDAGAPAFLFLLPPPLYYF